MFCVQCGKETEIYSNGVCLSCYLKEQTFSKTPLVIDIIRCSRCGSFKYKNTWVVDSFDTVFLRVLHDKISVSEEVKNLRIGFSHDPFENTFICRVTVTGLIKTEEICEHHELTVRIKQESCDVCSKQYGGYYEAVLQIRPAGKPMGKKELEELECFVEELVATAQQKGARTLFITDSGPEHGGLDFFLSDKSMALKIAKKIIEQRGGEFKQSSSLIGMREGEEVYRMTYLVRLPSYKPGDVVKSNNQYYFIDHASAQKIHVIDLVAGDAVTLPVKMLKDAYFFDTKSIKKRMIVVSQNNHEVQLMDEKTYKIYDVSKRNQERITADSVLVFIIDEHVFLAPEINTNNKNN